MLVHSLHVLSLVVLLVAGRIAPSPANDQEWPPLKSGKWELSTTWTEGRAGPRERKEMASACHDTAGLLQAYWGTGIVERAGCRFQSTKVSDAEFKVVTECVVRRLGTARSEATVTLAGDTTFSLRVRHVEGKHVTTLHQTGRWIATCPPSADTSP